MKFKCMNIAKRSLVPYPLHFNDLAYPLVTISSTNALSVK